MLALIGIAFFMMCWCLNMFLLVLVELTSVRFAKQLGHAHLLALVGGRGDMFEVLVGGCWDAEVCFKY